MAALAAGACLTSTRCVVAAFIALVKALAWAESTFWISATNLLTSPIELSKLTLLSLTIETNNSLIGFIDSLRDESAIAYNPTAVNPTKVAGLANNTKEAASAAIVRPIPPSPASSREPIDLTSSAMPNAATPIPAPISNAAAPTDNRTATAPAVAAAWGPATSAIKSAIKPVNAKVNTTMAAAA